jgi:hypothetical protein
VEPSEFAKAIEKIGIIIPTQQVSDHWDLWVSWCDANFTERAQEIWLSSKINYKL